MGTYKPPTFQERARLAAKAKEIAVSKHFAKANAAEGVSKPSPSVRLGKDAARQKTQEEHRKRQLLEKEARQQRAAELLELEAALPELSDGEKLLARSARYTRRTRS